MEIREESTSPIARRIMFVDNLWRQETEPLVRKVDDYIYYCVETDALTIQQQIVCMFQRNGFSVHIHNSTQQSYEFEMDSSG